MLTEKLQQIQQKEIKNRKKRKKRNFSDHHYLKGSSFNIIQLHNKRFFLEVFHLAYMKALTKS